MIEQVREHFSKNYPYVYLEDISDRVIRDYLDMGYVRDLEFEMQMNLLYDYVLSQNLTGVEE
jgi:hypothetical protein